MKSPHTYFFFTPEGGDLWRLRLLAQDGSSTFHKELTRYLGVPVMRFAGGEVVVHYRPDSQRASGISTSLYQSVLGLVGKLIVPNWCLFGELVYNGGQIT